MALKDLRLTLLAFGENYFCQVIPTDFPMSNENRFVNKPLAILSVPFLKDEL